MFSPAGIPRNLRKFGAIARSGFAKIAFFSSYQQTNLHPE